MKAFFVTVGLILAGLALILGLVWLFAGNDFMLLKFFGPRQEAVRRQTFEHSKAYRQGMAQEVRNYRIQYQTATKEQKQGLRSVILQELSDYPVETLAPDQQSWIEQLRNEQNQ